MVAGSLHSLYAVAMLHGQFLEIVLHLLVPALHIHVLKLTLTNLPACHNVELRA